MKFLIVLAALAACAYAKPGGLVSPLAYNGLGFGYNNLAYNGLGYNNLGYSNLGYSNLGYNNLGYNNLGYSNLGYNNFGYSAYAAAPATVNYGYSSYAAPHYAAPLAYAAAPAVATAFKSQYHAQDELGQASYGHSEPHQTHNAVQDAHGNKIGSYSYVAPDGKVVRTDYIADAAGYRVTSNALPVGPSELPVGPAPVEDTAEVVAARAAHLAEFEAVKSRTKRGAVAVLPAATAPLAYAYAAPHAYGYSAYASPLAYGYSGLAAPHAYGYSAYASPLAYGYSGLASPLAYSAVAAPAVRDATLTTVVNNPGHAVSYRVDK